MNRPLGLKQLLGFCFKQSFWFWRIDYNVLFCVSLIPFPKFGKCQKLKCQKQKSVEPDIVLTSLVSSWSVDNIYIYTAVFIGRHNQWPLTLHVYSKNLLIELMNLCEFYVKFCIENFYKDLLSQIIRKFQGWFKTSDECFNTDEGKFCFSRSQEVRNEKIPH